MHKCTFGLTVFLGVGASLHGAEKDFQAYQKYLDLYPSGHTDWSNDVQGIGHDENNWFISQTDVLWKIPVERDLDDVSDSDPGVIRRELDSYPDLYDAGYRHFGDLDVYRYDANAAYLVMPIEHHDQAEPGALAFFRCEDLSFVDVVELTNVDGEPYQGHDAGWCAVHPLGTLFSSMQHPGFNGGPSHLMEYALDWTELHVNHEAVISVEAIHHMYNEVNEPLNLGCMQGGEFAPGGRLLYLISGFLDDDEVELVDEGIHVLETTSWHRVGHSTNGYGQFNYYYDTGLTVAQEPEGLTIWDLDDGRAPGIRGQLHAINSDNDFPDGGDVYFYHYTNIIRVQAGASCGLVFCCPDCPPGAISCDPGTFLCPCHTVNEAAALAWNGSQIHITTGVYPESVTINRPVRLVAAGGTVRIGG